jgi:chromosome segregation ATPase
MKIPSSNLSQEGTISAIQEYIENQIEIKAEERVNATKLELERSVKTASNLANVVGDLKAELKGVEKKNKDDQKLFKQKEEALKEDLRILRESKSLATSEASGAANIRANSRTKIEDPQQKLPLIVERIVDLVKSEKLVSSDEFPEVSKEFIETLENAIKQSPSNKEAKAENKKLRKETEKLGKEIEKLRAEATEHEKSIVQLHKASGTISNENSELSRKNSELLKEIGQLKESLELLEHKEFASLAELRELEDRNVAIGEGPSIADELSGVGQDSSDLTDLTGQLEDARREIEKLQKSNGVFKAGKQEVEALLQGEHARSEKMRGMIRLITEKLENEIRVLGEKEIRDKQILEEERKKTSEAERSLQSTKHELEKLQSERLYTDGQLAELRKEHDLLAEKKNFVEQKLQRLQEERETLSRALGDAIDGDDRDLAVRMAQLVESHRTRDLLSEENSRLQAELEKFTNERLSLVEGNQKRDLTIVELERNLAESQNVLADKSSENKNLIEAYAATQSKLAQLHEELQRKVEQEGKIERNLKGLEAKLEIVELEKQNTSKDLEEANRQKEEASNRLVELGGTISKLQDQLESAQKAEGDLNNLKAETSAVKGELESAIKEKEEIAKKLLTAERSLQELRGDVTIMTSHMKDLRVKFGVKKLELKKVRKDLEQTQSDTQRVLQEFEEKVKKLESANLLLEQSQQKEQELFERMKEQELRLQEEKNALENQLRASKEGYDTQKEQLDVLKGMNEDLTKEKSEVLVEIQGTLESKRQLALENQSLQFKADDLRRELSEALGGQKLLGEELKVLKEAYERDIIARKQESEELSKVYKSSCSSNTELLDVLDKTRAKLKALKVDFRKKDLNLAIATKELDNVKGYYAKAEGSLQSLEEQTKKAQERLTDDLRVTTEERRVAQKKADELDIKHFAALGEIDSLKVNLANAQRDEHEALRLKGEALGKLVSLEAALKAKEKDLEKSKGELDSLNLKYAESQNSLESAQEASQKTTSIIFELEEKLQRSSDSKKVAQVQAAENIRHNKELQQQLEQMKREQSALFEEKKDLMAELESVAVKLQKSSEQFEGSRKSMKNLEQEHSKSLASLREEHEKQLEEYKEKTEQINRKLEKVQRKLHKSNTKVAQLEAEVEQLDQRCIELESLKKEGQQIQSELREAQSKLVESNSELAKAEETSRTIGVSHSDTQGLLEQTWDQLQRLQLESEKGQRELDATIEQLKQHEEENRELMQENRELKESMANLGSAEQSHKSTTKDLREQLKDAAKTRQDLELELEDLRKKTRDNIDEQAELEKSRKEVKRLNEEKAHLVETLEKARQKDAELEKSKVEVRRLKDETAHLVKTLEKANQEDAEEQQKVLKENRQEIARLTKENEQIKEALHKSEQVTKESLKNLQVETEPANNTLKSTKGKLGAKLNDPLSVVSSDSEEYSDYLELEEPATPKATVQPMEDPRITKILRDANREIEAQQKLLERDQEEMRKIKEENNHIAQALIKAQKEAAKLKEKLAEQNKIQQATMVAEEGQTPIGKQVPPPVRFDRRRSGKVASVQGMEHFALASAKARPADGYSDNETNEDLEDCATIIQKWQAMARSTYLVLDPPTVTIDDRCMKHVTPSMLWTANPVQISHIKVRHWPVELIRAVPQQYIEYVRFEQWANSRDTCQAVNRMQRAKIEENSASFERFRAVCK